MNILLREMQSHIINLNVQDRMVQCDHSIWWHFTFVLVATCILPSYSLCNYLAIFEVCGSVVIAVSELVSNILSCWKCTTILTSTLIHRTHCMGHDKFWILLRGKEVMPTKLSLMANSARFAEDPGGKIGGGNWNHLELL